MDTLRWNDQRPGERVLRIWLGATFTYAGIEKLADPGFLSRGSTTYIGSQLDGFAHGSPVAPLLHLAGHAPVATGVAVAIVEILVGVATLSGVVPSVAATVGLLLSVTLWLSASWHIHPYFLGSDSIYAIAWLAYLVSLPGLAAFRGGVRAWVREAREDAADEDLSEDPLSADDPRTDVADAAELGGRDDVVVTGAIAAAAAIVDPDGDTTDADPADVDSADADPADVDTADVDTADVDTVDSDTADSDTDSDDGDDGDRVDDRRRHVLRGSALVAGGLALGGLAGLVGRSRRTTPTAAVVTPIATPSIAATPTATATDSTGASPSPSGSATGIASVSALDAQGSVNFTAPGGGPAVVVALPDGTPAAYSRICTHSGCTASYDPASRLIICPCHGSEFNPAAQGAVVQGPATQPLPQIAVQVDPAADEITLA